MRRRESEQLTERPIVEKGREEMKGKVSNNSKSMMKSKHNIKPVGLAPESEIIQKRGSSYKSRYNGLLSSEKEIIQKKPADYKNSRYR